MRHGDTALSCSLSFLLCLLGGLNTSENYPALALILFIAAGFLFVCGATSIALVLTRKSPEKTGHPEI